MKNDWGSVFEFWRKRSPAELVGLGLLALAVGVCFLPFLIGLAWFAAGAWALLFLFLAAMCLDLIKLGGTGIKVFVAVMVVLLFFGTLVGLGSALGKYEKSIATLGTLQARQAAVSGRARHPAHDEAVKACSLGAAVDLTNDLAREAAQGGAQGAAPMGGPLIAMLFGAARPNRCLQLREQIEADDPEYFHPIARPAQGVARPG